MRVFEETFGIDKLQTLVSKIGVKLEQQEFEPANGKFLLQGEDLTKMLTVLDEFKTRHATITADIE